METVWVDFKAVKAAVTMRMVLDHYELTPTLKASGDELRGRCPIHNGEGADAFHVNVQKNCFQCFAGSCRARGNVLDFVAAMEQCSVRDAAVKIAEWFSVSEPKQQSKKNGNGPRKAAAPEKGSSREESSSRVGTMPKGEDATAENRPLTFELKGVNPEHQYLAERGVDRKTAELFGVGFFSGKGSMSGRVVIPIHNERGELIAYAGRAVDDTEPRYKLPAGFHKTAVLYNLHRALQFNNRRVAIVVEGFFDCMRLHQARYPCVGLMGCSMSEEQEHLLRRHFTGAVLFFDGDKAGRSAMDDCLLRLGRGWWVKAVVMPDGLQPDTLEIDEIEQLLEES